MLITHTRAQPNIATNAKGVGVVSHRAVEHALAIHGNVEATLHPLDRHHSQTHRNKIKQGCRADRVRDKEGGREGQTDRYKETETKERPSETKDRIGRLSFHLTLVDMTASDLYFLAICQLSSKVNNTGQRQWQH